MIGKSHIISFAVVVSLYMIVAVWKYVPINTEIENQTRSEQRSDRADIVAFWDHYNTAISYRSDRDYEQAAYYYEQALEVNAQHEDALYYLGSMYLFQREFEKAEQMWLKLEEIQPNSPRTQLQLGTLYFCMDDSNDLFNIEMASKRFEHAWNLNREETGSPLLLSKIAMLNGEYDKAGDLLDIVIVSNIMSYQARYLKGYLEWMEGRESASRDNFRKARDIFQSLAYSEIQGEGATKAGARAMLSEDRFCNAFESQIDELLAENGMLDHDSHYEKFSDSIKSWR